MLTFIIGFIIGLIVGGGIGYDCAKNSHLYDTYDDFGYDDAWDEVPIDSSKLPTDIEKQINDRLNELANPTGKA